MRTYDVENIDRSVVRWADAELAPHLARLVENHRPRGRALPYEGTVRNYRLVEALRWRLRDRGWRLRRLTDPLSNRLFLWVERP